MEPAEQLPASAWFNNLLLQLGKSWDLGEPAPQGVGQLIAAVNSDVLAAATALSASAAGLEETSSAAGMPVLHRQQTSQVPGSDAQLVPAADAGSNRVLNDAAAEAEPEITNIQPTSATAVLL
jgi:hypothetical protein